MTAAEAQKIGALGLLAICAATELHSHSGYAFSATYVRILINFEDKNCLSTALYGLLMQCNAQFALYRQYA